MTEQCQTTNDSYGSGLQNDSYGSGLQNDSYGSGLQNDSYGSGLRNDSYGSGLRKVNKDLTEPGNGANVAQKQEGVLAVCNHADIVAAPPTSANVPAKSLL